MTERLFCIEIQNKYLFSFLAYVHGSVNHKSDFFILSFIHYERERFSAAKVLKQLTIYIRLGHKLFMTCTVSWWLLQTQKNLRNGRKSLNFTCPILVSQLKFGCVVYTNIIVLMVQYGSSGFISKVVQCPIETMKLISYKG